MLFPDVRKARNPLQKWCAVWKHCTWIYFAESIICFNASIKGFYPSQWDRLYNSNQCKGPTIGTWSREQASFRPISSWRVGDIFVLGNKEIVKQLTKVGNNYNRMRESSGKGYYRAEMRGSHVDGQLGFHKRGGGGGLFMFERKIKQCSALKIS